MIDREYEPKLGISYTLVSLSQVYPGDYQLTMIWLQGLFNLIRFY